VVSITLRVGTYCIRGLVGLKVGLNAISRMKITETPMFNPVSAEVPVLN